MVLLLGNIRFSEHRTSDSGCSSSDPEIQSVASLLGIGSDLLFRGLTTRTHSVRGQLVKSMCDANMVSHFILNDIVDVNIIKSRKSKKMSVVIRKVIL